MGHNTIVIINLCSLNQVGSKVLGLNEQNFTSQIKSKGQTQVDKSMGKN